MAADIVSDTIQWAAQQECVVIMDDYGNTTVTYIPASQVSDRVAIISAVQTVVVNNQAAIVALATAASITVPIAMTLTQKQAAWAAKVAVAV